MSNIGCGSAAVSSVEQPRRLGFAGKLLSDLVSALCEIEFGDDQADSSRQRAALLVQEQIEEVRKFERCELEALGISRYFLELIFDESRDFILSELELIRFVFECGCISKLIEMQNKSDLNKKLIVFSDGTNINRFFYAEGMEIPAKLPPRVVEAVRKSCKVYCDDGPVVSICGLNPDNGKWQVERCAIFGGCRLFETFFAPFLSTDSCRIDSPKH